jgi:hypothetical protein
MPLAYYGVTLPDKHNWVETPEGYLIFKNAVVGRTGFQTYKGFELDADELMEQGIKVQDDDDVQLYRSPDEVFSPKTIASFVGKSVTDGHPSELLSLENVKDHEEGQVVNVRRGSEPLDSGDFPLIADLIVKSRNLIDKIKAGLRELSCGYNYHVLKDGDVIKQVDIIGNHIAVVENARAGREAVIVDSTPVTSTERFNIMSLLDSILNRNSKSKVIAWAKDAKPEEVADVITELSTAVDKHSEVIPKVTVKESKKAVATDATDALDRKRFHDALDRYFDSSEEEEAAKDADVQALADMFKHPKAKDAANDEEEEEKKEKKEEEDEAEEEEEKEGEDDAGALTIEPSDRPKSAGPGTDSLIAARKEGAREVLKLLKPLVAKTGDKKLIAAFDTAARAVQGKSKSSSAGGYGKFAEASNRRGKDALDSMEESDNKKKHEEIKSLEKMYSDRFVARR